MIHFDEATHTYTLDDGRTLISVTQLMKKHGLATDYTGVKRDVLARAAERGTLIHKEIEEFIKTGAIGFTPEMMAFRDYLIEKDLCAIESEMIVHDDLIAGTIDLVLSPRTFLEKTIADIKTTKSLNKEAVCWQLSLYNYLIGWEAEKAQALHFDEDGALKVVDLPFKPKEEVERLIDCERRGVIYTKPTAVALVTDQQVATIAEAEKIIAEADAAKKEAEARIAEIKAALMAEMEARGLKSFETDRVKLTYVPPSERTTIDSAKLKKERPEIAEEYSKTTKVAPSLRITIKE